MKYIMLLASVAFATSSEAQTAPRPNLSTPTRVAVDRVEADSIAVLVDADGRQFDVPIRALPYGVREGTVLRITIVAPPKPKRPARLASRCGVEAPRYTDDDSVDMGYIPSTQEKCR
jgi:hypothetical protein